VQTSKVLNRSCGSSIGHKGLFAGRFIVEESRRLLGKMCGNMKWVEGLFDEMREKERVTKGLEGWD
jgi:hypothetical protein